MSRLPPTLRPALAASLLALTLGVAPARAQEEEPETPVGQVLERAFPAVVRVHGAGGFTNIPAYGSGVVVHERGFVLTAWSIALRTDHLRVVDALGRDHPAVVWRADPGLGVALLKVDTAGGAGFTALRLGSSDDLQPGQPVVAFGNPFGFLYGDERPAVLRGVVSALTEPRRGGFRLVRFPSRLERVILTDIPNNPGTQGGPLLTLDGRLVGILGRLVESRATNTILNFAVPAAAMRAFVEEGVRGREARPAAPEPAPRTDDVPPELGLRLQRAHLVRSPLPYVERVVSGSVADEAGLAAGDLIFRVGERTVRSCRDCDEALAALEPGPAPLVVKRGDRMLALTITLPAETGRDR